MEIPESLTNPEEVSRKEALEQMESFLKFLFPRSDGDKFREIAGSILWRIKTKGPFRHGEANKFSEYYKFDTTSFSRVRALLEDSGVLNGWGELSPDFLTRINKAYVALIFPKVASQR
jgi:hypothetical protein